ncbi:MAG TPA: hypothetical protein ENN85_02995 [Methanoculleus sp.]|nr:hypothetical protein [Methanoculleus sp.]
MVNDQAQMYTLEGFAAGVLMLLTAYLVLGTTTVYTPGDVHITDMQLQQLGSDALAMMDLPDTEPEIYGSGENILEKLIVTDNSTDFRTYFLDNITRTTDPKKTVVNDIQFNATIYYRMESPPVNESEIQSYHFCSSGNDARSDLVSREPAVRVTRFVTIDAKHYPPNPKPQITLNHDVDERAQVVLLEVLLWRG